MPLTNDDISTLFATSDAAIADNPNLREPQRLGHAAAKAYFDQGGTHAIEQIPVGCGKTGLITVLPFGIARSRVLVIAPNLTIARQLTTSFNPTSPKSTYRRFGVLADLSRGPWVAHVDAEANIGDLIDSHVVVANIQQLISRSGRWLSNLTQDFFDLIIADEAHHTAAASWQTVFGAFPNARIISLTATPFRADNQPVDGDMIYRYPIAEAMRKGYITNITACNVAPAELEFRYGDSTRTHRLEEVLQLRERDWFSRGVALSDACNVSIVDASIQWMEHLRENSTIRHQIVAAACSVVHARRIRALYQERGLNAQEIHSNMSSDEQERIHHDLETGRLDVIVQVQMLGEGFDHPPLSVAAFFRPYRSLSPYIQFAGRVMRVNKPSAVTHPDNRAVLVSHVGLNIERHWDDFKLIDSEDRELVGDWLAAGATMPRRNGGPGGRPPVIPHMRVASEQILDRFLTEEFLDVPDEQLPDRILDAVRAQGIDPNAAGLDRDIILALMQERRAGRPDSPIAQLVLPQARRKARRALLRETTNTVAKRICDAVGLHAGGRRLAARGCAGASTDLDAAIRLLGRAVNEHVGRPANTRRDWTTEEIDNALADIEQIADGVEADIRTRLS